MKKLITSIATFSFLLATTDAGACDGNKGKDKDEGKKDDSSVIAQR